jgi:hypothetical protein
MAFFTTEETAYDLIVVARSMQTSKEFKFV